MAWTPDGFFAASNNGEGARLVGYSLNQGIAALAQYVSIEQLYERFYRPDLLSAKLHGDPAHLLEQQDAALTVETVLPQSLPPQVAIVQPTPNLTTAQREVAVQIQLTDQGGGTGKIVWSIDGVTLGVTRASTAQAGRGRSLSDTQRLPLTPGTNTITVVAYDQHDRVASAPATLAVHLALSAPAPAAPAAPPVPPVAPSPSHASPPLVTFLTPATDTTVTQSQVDVQVALTDQGSGIGKILWTLNAAPVAAEASRGSAGAKRGGKRGMHTMEPQAAAPGTRQITKSLLLTPGTNTITVVAYSGDNTVASPPAVRTLQWTTRVHRGRGSGPATDPAHGVRPRVYRCCPCSSSASIAIAIKPSGYSTLSPMGRNSSPPCATSRRHSSVRSV